MRPPLARAPRVRPAAFFLAMALTACGGGEPPADEVASDAEPGVPAEAEPSVPGDPGVGPDTGRVTGLWSVLPGGPVLTPCGSDAVWAVVGATDAVGRRVRLERPDASGPVPVTLTGVPLSGDTLRVGDVVAVHAGDSCPGSQVDQPLEGTAWQLAGLPEPRPEVVAVGAWLRLVEDEARLEGSTGCMPLTGRVTREVTRLRFSALAPAPGACRGAGEPVDLVRALAATGSYRLRGDTLELLGESGPVATFRAPGG